MECKPIPKPITGTPAREDKEGFSLGAKGSQWRA